jgi:hypothetical protein
MAIITQNSRISHHTITTSGNTFSVPPTEDFTTGTWTKEDLALSEIGIDQFQEKAFIRIGSNIKEINLSPLPFSVGGSANSIQFNNGGLFSGTSNLTFINNTGTTSSLNLVGSQTISGSNFTFNNNVNGPMFNFNNNLNSGTLAFIQHTLQSGPNTAAGVTFATSVLGTGYTSNSYLTGNVFTNYGSQDYAANSRAMKAISYINANNVNSAYEWHYNSAFPGVCGASTLRASLNASTGDFVTSGSSSITSLTLRTTPTLNSGSTQTLVRNTSTGVVEYKNTSDYVQSNGAKFNYVAKTANYTALTTDYSIDCTSNSFTVTLPTAVGNTGLVLIIKNSGTATTITIATTSSQTIDGDTPSTYNLTNKTPLRVQSNGSNWIII